MRIVSLNAWGGAVHDDLVGWVSTVDADVLCFQEITRTAGLGGWTTFDDAERRLPQRANLFDDLRRVLPRHQAFFVASDAGPVHDEHGHTHHQDFGLAVFVHERLPVIGQASAFVHGSFIDHAEWAITDRPRIAQGVRLLDRDRRRTFTVVHVHGLRDPAGKQDTPARQAQARRLTELIETLRQAADITVLCGDLNLLPDSASFGEFARIGLHDLVRDADTRTSLYPKPLRSASYFLVSEPAVVRRFNTPAEPEVSDHRALIADL